MQFRDVITPLVASKTLGYVAGLAIALGAYSLLAIGKEYTQFAEAGTMPSQLHAALSLVLGCLLVFRTNTAYNRWWEARTLWGTLVNASRNTAIKLHHLARISSDDLGHARSLLVALPVALKHHLRDESQQLPESVKQLSGYAAHVPQALMNQLYGIVARAKRSGAIDGQDLLVLDTELTRFLDVCGGCERIQRTRIVTSYRTFARQCILLVLLTLPWGVAHDFGWWTLPLTIIVSYFMIGLETVAEHVEEPFGYDEDDLDLDGICRAIESSVNEILGV
jgi:ion channel-forming bestrophin family protein